MKKRSRLFSRLKFKESRSLTAKSIRDGVGFILSQRVFLLLVLVLVVFSWLGLFFSGVLKGVYLLFNYVLSFVLYCLVLCFLKKKVFTEALDLVRKYVWNLFVLQLLMVVISAGMFIFYGILTSILLSPFFSPYPSDNSFIGMLFVFIAISLFVTIPALVIALYICIRLSLAAALIVFEDDGPIESLKKSWRITKGRVVAIAFTLIVPTVPYLLFLSVSTPLSIFTASITSPEVSSVLSFLTRFADSLYFLSLQVFVVMLYKNIVGPRMAEK